MSVRRAALALASVAFASLAWVSSAAAHADDPKIFDRVPPYDGPGWLRPDGGAALPLGGIDHDFPYQNMTLWAWITLPEVHAGLTSGNDCWGYVSPSRREYGIYGTSDGTAFIEVTSPNHPVVVEFVPGPNSIWRDIKVFRSFAYIVSEGGSGIQVVDLSGIDAGVVSLVRTVVEGGTTTHNVAINTQSGYLYRAGGDGNGLRIYSLRDDPSNPRLVGAWPDRYVHDTQVVTYTNGRFAGREIAFCFGGFNGGWSETGLDILDVTDKANIRQVSRLVYAQGSYSHQGWLTEDRHYVYLDDELDEQQQGVTTRTRVIDVSDLRRPTVVSTFTSGSTSIDHNLYVRGGLVFEANYRSGLRVFDASAPTAPVQIAWFDTWPDDDNANFNGLWSVYPFFPSGTIIASDIERGLFVLTLGAPTPGGVAPGGLPGLSREGGALAGRVHGLSAEGAGDLATTPPVVLNEIAWSAHAGHEWVELLNVSGADLDLSGWKLESADGRTVAPLSGVVPNAGLMVVAHDGAAPCVTAQVTTSTDLLSGGGVTLRAPNGDVVERVDKWLAGDGALRATMERRDPLRAATDASSWRTASSAYCGMGLGSPGALNATERPAAPRGDVRSAPRRSR